MKTAHLKALALAMSFAAMLSFGEWFLRASVNASKANPLEGFALGLLFALFIVYAKSRALSVALSVFVGFGVVVELANLAFFGYFVGPMEIWLLFKKFPEVASAAGGLVFAKGQALAVIFACLASLGSLQIARKIVPPPPQGRWILDVFIVLALAFYPVRLFLSPSSTLGRFAKERHSLLKSYIYVTARFVAQTLPQEVLGLSNVKSYSRPKPRVVQKPLTKRIVFIVGESLSSHYVSAFGSYALKTTPFLDSQAKNGKVIIGKAFSAGLFTDVSVPSLVHMVARPNGVRHIYSHDSNLYRMAQEIGYKTAFFSVQSADGNNYTNLFKQYLDFYEDAQGLTNSRYSSADDAYLVEFLERFDAGSASLILLNQVGSHEPYTVPKGFEVFGSGNFLDKYLNTVTYTDGIIRQIQDVVQRRFGNESWVLIYTSDHGQHVTQNTGGKGGFAFASNYEVPFYITSNSPRVMQETAKIFGKCEFAFAVQISEFIGLLLGYDNEISSCASGYVNGNNLNGDTGYMKITQEGGVQKREIF